MALQRGLQALELALTLLDFAPQGLELRPIECPVIGHQHRPLDAEDLLLCPVAPDSGQLGLVQAAHLLSVYSQ